MKMTIRVQLSLMMFLQFVVWGSWYGQLSKYLVAIGFDGAQVGNVYSVFNRHDHFSLSGGDACGRFLLPKAAVLNLAGALILFFLTKMDMPITDLYSIVNLRSHHRTTSSISMCQMTAPRKIPAY